MRHSLKNSSNAHLAGHSESLSAPYESFIGTQPFLLCYRLFPKPSQDWLYLILNSRLTFSKPMRPWPESDMVDMIYSGL
jgi:hypothetical protein